MIACYILDIHVYAHVLVTLTAEFINVLGARNIRC